MKRNIGLLAGLITLALPCFAAAQDTKTDQKACDNCALSYYISSAINNRYVFRGMTLYDGMSLQPNVGLSYDFGAAGRINGNVWAQLPLESHDEKTIDQFSEAVTGFSDNEDQEIFSPKKKFIELDPTLSYDVTFGMVTLSAGHTWYTDPQKGEVTIIRPGLNENGDVVPVAFNTIYSRGDTSEFFLGAALDTILNPEVTFVKDYRKFDYEYYTLGFSQELPLAKGSNTMVIPNVLFAWATNTKQAGAFSTNYSRDGLEHINLGIKARLFAEGLTITPSLTYVFTLDRFEGKDNIIWGGVDIGFSS